MFAMGAPRFLWGILGLVIRVTGLCRWRSDVDFSSGSDALSVIRAEKLISKCERWEFFFFPLRVLVLCPLSSSLLPPGTGLAGPMGDLRILSANAKSNSFSLLSVRPCSSSRQSFRFVYLLLPGPSSF